jgi:hypothetical protein
MYRITGSDGQQYGPVTEAQIKEWIATGRANGQTLAQTETSPDWRPLSSFAEFGDALAAKAAGGAPPPTAPEAVSAAWADAVAAEILARDYRVEIGSCISRGWDLVMNHFWLLVGASFVLGLIQGAVPLLTGVCMGGIYWLCLKLMRGERAEFGDCFAGFSQAFLQLFLAGLVSGALTMVGFGLCILPGIYLAVAWVFCLPLVMDKKLDFWPAMELSRQVATKHGWVLLGLLLVGALLNLLGLLVCCVGVYVAQPVVLAALAYAYEDIFAGRRPPAAAPA